jgi:hypothetical protein
MRLRTLAASALLVLTGTFPAFAAADDPIFGPGTYDRTLGGLQFYRQIVAEGGWGKLPPRRCTGGWRYLATSMPASPRGKHLTR